METPTPADDSPGQQFERLGFTFCKLGTICLIAFWPAYALLLASGLTIYFYLRAMQEGVTRSDCFLRHPLVIVGFWGLVGAADLAWLVWTHR